MALKELGIEYGAAKVGDRYVLEMMQKKGAVLGGEASGHIIFLDHHTTGDGIISALQLLAAMRRTGKPLSELAQVMKMAPQKMINVDVERKPPLEEIAGRAGGHQGGRGANWDKGRVLVRYSGTQSMCRVMVEGPPEEMIDRLTPNAWRTWSRSASADAEKKRKKGIQLCPAK